MTRSFDATKVLSITKVVSILEAKTLQLSLLYSFLIFFLPTVIHQQFLVGPIVNALLILSFLHLGKSHAFFLALIPSTVALSRGLLPLALAPMVPFIMISNCLYIEVFARLEGSSRVKNFLAILLASAVKTAFLFAIAKILMENILVGGLASHIAMMMSWPQFATAILGGFMALVINEVLKKQYVSR
jgi:hypothetical protein